MTQRFKLDTKTFFLTYPQNDTDPNIAMIRIKDYFKENILEILIAQEQHKDEHNHLHIYLKLKERLQTTKNTYFNFIADKQGNYQGCKKPTDVIKYIIKTGNYITHNIDPTKYLEENNKKTKITSKGIFKQITDEITKETDYRDIFRKYPEICLQHGKKIQEYITTIKIIDKPKYRDWEMNVEYHYGDTGTGKSKYAFTGFNPETHYVLRKSNGENTVWWDGYTGQETIIIDDFTPKSYRLSYMLNMLDRYAMTIDTKGGSTQLLAKRIIITSNYSPENLYTKEDCKEHRNALLRRITKYVEYKKEKENEEDVEHQNEVINTITNQTNCSINKIKEEEKKIDDLPVDEPFKSEEDELEFRKEQEEYQLKNLLNKPKLNKCKIPIKRFTYNKYVEKYWDGIDHEWVKIPFNDQEEMYI